MKRDALTCKWITSLLLLLSFAFFLHGEAFGQKAREITKSLTLPKDIKKPDLPRSDQAYFDEIPAKSVLLEILLHKDGTITGFEKRTMSDLFNKTCHAVRYDTRDRIRGLLYQASRLSEKITMNSELEIKVANVDLVIHAAPDTPLHYLQWLVQDAVCEPINIFRYHIRVKDPETGKEGCLSYYLPCDLVGESDPKADELRTNIYNVSLYNCCFDAVRSAGPVYELKAPGSAAPGAEYKSLADLGKAMDAAKKQNPRAAFQMTLGGVPREEQPPHDNPATLGDLVAFMNLLRSKGADLKNTTAVIEEVYELQEEDK